MTDIRLCRDTETETMFTIINDGAQAYRGAVPADCLHDPYMSLAELRSEIAAGVTFWGCDIDGVLAGIMGVQAVKDVTLIRHAYVATDKQGHGIGSQLIRHIMQTTANKMLVGTWTDARWAIQFYQRHGFTLVSPDQKVDLLKTYWTVSERQIETSVVLTT